MSDGDLDNTGTNPPGEDHKIDLPKPPPPADDGKPKDPVGDPSPREPDC